MCQILGLSPFLRVTGFDEREECHEFNGSVVREDSRVKLKAARRFFGVKSVLAC
ncbi:MAG TPA: hypothetical protein PKC79_03890 [Solidesulfovibrio magneticus]|jgi:hypothetical protein|nr:hypothetical protein [Solidesulfovibrio magneticus]